MSELSNPPITNKEMSIRKNTNPRPLELPPEMRDILARNGMRGHIAGSSEGFVLIVQGHDSPLLSYPITEKQLQALTDWVRIRSTAGATTPSPASWLRTSTFPVISYTRGTPTGVWPWGCTATASELANTGGLDGHSPCATHGEPVSSAGRPGIRTASTFGASAATSIIPAHRWCQTDQTGA